MNYNIEITAGFSKQLKRLVKKYPSLKAEFIKLVAALREKPDLGTSLGDHCYKIRIAIASKGKGKSGGARVITHLKIIDATIYLLSVYDKSEQSDISDNDLSNLLKNL